MAVITNFQSKKVQIKYMTGVTPEGKDIVKTKTYSGVKSDATDQDIYDVAGTIIGLQNYTAQEVRKAESYELTE